MKKKLVGVLLSAAMVSTLLAGCGSKPAETTATTTKETDAAATDAAATDAATTEAADATEAATTEAADGTEAADATEAADGETIDGEGMSIEIVSKGFQHQYWQAVLKGAEEQAKKMNVKIHFVGPNSESDTADQVQMLNSAINTAPKAIALAALNTETCLDSIADAQSKGIPIIGFDSGVPGAPEGSVVANAATDNYAAGALAAEKTYEAIKEKVASATEPVRIGVMGQDATSESIVNRGLGFIDKIGELAIADGKTVSVVGNDKYINDSLVEKTEGADVVIDVAVPAQVTSELSTIDCQTLLNKPDTIAVYGSNQHSGEAMVTANENLKKFGVGDDKVVGATFDSGTVIKKAVTDGIFIGAITQAPVSMGAKTVELCVLAALGKPVADVDTGCQWYTAETIENPEIAQNLYD